MKLTREQQEWMDGVLASIKPDLDRLRHLNGVVNDSTTE